MQKINSLFLPFILIVSLFGVQSLYSNTVISAGIGYAHSSTYEKTVDDTTIKVPPIMLAFETYFLPFIGVGADFTGARYGEQAHLAIRARLVLQFSIPVTPISIYAGGNTGVAVVRGDSSVSSSVIYSGFAGLRVYVVPSLVFLYLEGGYPYPNVMGGVGIDI